MAKRIILKSETEIKNSAVGFSYITVYFGSLVPLFRLDIIGFLKVLLSVAWLLIIFLCTLYLLALFCVFYSIF